MPFNPQKLIAARGALSQAQACARIAAVVDKPVYQQLYSRWEQGESAPSAEYLEALAQVFGITIDSLFDHNGDDAEVAL